MKQYSALLLLLFFVVSCSGPESQAEEIYSFMQGTFNSGKQAEENPNYYDITVRFSHIWEEREGKWVYAEFCVSKAPEQPFSQRIYKITELSKDSIEMESFDLKERESFVGKWKDPSAFDALTEEDLIRREGCNVFFQKTGEEYIGETRGKNCIPSIGKAEYSTHQLRISADKVVHWSKGFDENDEMVWGQSGGGYVLNKVEIAEE